jgi:hypothetical protein
MIGPDDARPDKDEDLDKAEPPDKPEPPDASEKPSKPEHPTKPKRATRSGGPSTRSMRLVALLGLGVVAIVLGLMLILDDSNDSSSGDVGGEARIVSLEELQEAAAGGETPIYWAGPQAEAELELSQPEAGRTFVRYLTGGAEAGDPGADFLTVGTYADDHPVDALKRQGKEPGGVLVSAPGGATVYFSRNNPHSVYLAYPGVAAQIEVYDPDFKRALQLVESGQIVSAG